MRRYTTLLLVIATCCAMLLPGGLPGAQAGPAIRGDPQVASELMAVYNRFDQQRSWRSRMNLPGPPPGTVTAEFVAPNRHHIVMSVGGQVTDIYLIGDTMYVKGDGTCTRLPQKINVPNPRDHMQQDANAVIEATRGGAETVEGTPTQTYNITITAQGRTIRQKMYVATATGLPRRIESMLTEGRVVIDYLEYGAGIVINDPPC